jgi:hypothetical protein
MIEKTIINWEEHWLPAHKVSIRNIWNGDEPESALTDIYVPIENWVIVELYFAWERWPQRVDGVTLDNVYYTFSPDYLDTTQHNKITWLVVWDKIFIWDRVNYSDVQN